MAESYKPLKIILDKPVNVICTCDGRQLEMLEREIASQSQTIEDLREKLLHAHEHILELSRRKRTFVDDVFIDLETGTEESFYERRRERKRPSQKEGCIKF